MGFDDKDEVIELDLDELSDLIEGCAEEDLDLDDLANFFEKSSYENIKNEELESESRSYYEAMNQSLANEEYGLAFNYARKLKKRQYSRYKRQIDRSYEMCADHGVIEAVILAAEKYTVRGDGLLKPEAFPYLKKLSEIGYIWSFRYLGDCYYYGIGCERDYKKAEQSYFEGMLFEGCPHCRDRYAEFHMGMDEYEGDDLQKRIISGFVSHGWGHEEYARYKMAEMIYGGRIKEYSRESAYVILRDLMYSCDGIPAAKLGECILYGIGHETDPKVARQVLDWALDDLRWIVDYLDDEWTQEEIAESLFEERDYTDAYENAQRLITEADGLIKKLDNGMNNAARDALYDEDQMFELWFDEKERFITRSRWQTGL